MRDDEARCDCRLPNVLDSFRLQVISLNTFSRKGVGNKIQPLTGREH